MLNLKQAMLLVGAAGFAFALWEGVGHHFLMALPMAVRHGLSIAISTALALLLTVSVARIIIGQHRQLQKLARLRDYLARMEAHYQRLPAASIGDPARQFESQRRRERLLESLQELAARSPAQRARAFTEVASIATDDSAPLLESRNLFQQASPHIAAALYLERDSLARAEALQAVRTLGDFAQQRDGELLLRLLKELAHANRAALHQLLEAIGSWRVATQASDGTVGSRHRLHALWQVTRLVETEESGISLLDELVKTDEVSSVAATGSVESAPAGSASLDRALLSELNLTASCLRDTCTAIKSVLDRLPSPEPTDGERTRQGHADRDIRLEECFLADIDLSDAQLDGANLEGAWLQAASLCGTHLLRAELSEARLRGAHLQGADLRSARLVGADLRGAGLSSANLEGANLARAKLAGAYLIGVELRGAILWEAEFDELVDGQRTRAELSRSNWWDASFDDPLTGRTDKAAKAWVSTLYPQPAERV